MSGAGTGSIRHEVRGVHRQGQCGLPLHRLSGHADGVERRARREQYVLPDNVPANEFLNFEGQKFSKSRGWGIDVEDFLARYPADPLRYYLACPFRSTAIRTSSWKEFQAKNNNELADILGNFVNRTLAFCGRTFGGIRAGPRRAGRA